MWFLIIFGRKNFQHRLCAKNCEFEVAALPSCDLNMVYLKGVMLLMGQLAFTAKATDLYHQVPHSYDNGVPIPQYNYGYSVLDSYSGNNFNAAQESTDGKLLPGFYALINPSKKLPSVVTLRMFNCS